MLEKFIGGQIAVACPGIRNGGGGRKSESLFFQGRAQLRK